MSRAARAAIARAKRRGAEEVTPDDLLAGALGETARFGIALVGPWTIDMTEVDGGSTGPESSTEDRSVRAEPCSDGTGSSGGEPARGPRYSKASVAVFEEASRLARQEEEPTLRLVHLLAALGGRDDGLMARLRGRYGFTPVEWRAALARGELGAAVSDGGADAAPRVLGASAPGGPELLSVDQAAAFLGVHSQTVRNYIRAGKLPGYRLAGERFIRVLRRDLLALLEPVAADDEQEVETELPIDPSTKE